MPSWPTDAICVECGQPVAGLRPATGDTLIEDTGETLRAGDYDEGVCLEHMPEPETS